MPILLNRVYRFFLASQHTQSRPGTGCIPEGNSRFSVRRKEERRAQLAKAAEDMKSSGKAESAFEDSGYAVGEGEPASCIAVSLRKTPCYTCYLLGAAAI